LATNIDFALFKFLPLVLVIFTSKLKAF